MRCDVCGQRVAVSTGNEGTSSYEPVAEEDCARLREENEKLRAVADAAKRCADRGYPCACCDLGYDEEYCTCFDSMAKTREHVEGLKQALQALEGAGRGREGG